MRCNLSWLPGIPSTRLLPEHGRTHTDTETPWFQRFPRKRGKGRTGKDRLMAPRAGLEPATNGLTVRRSTTELPGNTEGRNRRRAILRKAPGRCQGGTTHDGGLDRSRNLRLFRFMAQTKSCERHLRARNSQFRRLSRPAAMFTIQVIACYAFDRATRLTAPAVSEDAKHRQSARERERLELAAQGKGDWANSQKSLPKQFSRTDLLPLLHMRSE